MERRDVLKLLTSATVLPALGSDALFWLEGIHARVAKASVLRTLTPEQDATVSTIAELIIPSDGHARRQSGESERVYRPHFERVV